MNEDTNNDQGGAAAEVELSDSVTAARASNLRETNPELFGGEKKVEAPSADDAGAAAAAAAAADPAADTGEHAEEGGETQLIPRARLNEVVQAKKTAIEERDALRTRLDALERAETDRAAAAQVAAAEAAKLPARDIEAEIDALDQRFEDGEIEKEQQLRERRELRDLLRAQVRDEAVATALAAVEQRNAQNQQMTATQQWEAATTKFLGAAENSAYKEPIRQAALNEAMKAVSAEHSGNISYDELLQTARDRVELAFGGKPSAGGETVQQKVERDRRAAAVKAAAGVSALPERPLGGVGERASQDGADVLSISRAEWRKMPQAKKDEMLGKTGS